MSDTDFTPAYAAGLADAARQRLLTWRSIDTAPKDQFVLLYCREDDSRWLAKWQGGVWYGVDDQGLTREGHSFGDPDFVTGWFVTAWMPLPLAPIL